MRGPSKSPEGDERAGEPALEARLEEVRARAVFDAVGRTEDLLARHAAGRTASGSKPALLALGLGAVAVVLAGVGLLRARDPAPLRARIESLETEVRESARREDQARTALESANRNAGAESARLREELAGLRKELAALESRVQALTRTPPRQARPERQDDPENPPAARDPKQDSAR